MPFGEAGGEKVNLKVDSLWSGGPVESAPVSYLSLIAILFVSI